MGACVGRDQHAGAGTADARATKTPDALDAIVSKLRVYAISDQDDAGAVDPARISRSALHRHPVDDGWRQYHLATWTGISGDRFYQNAPGADFTTFTDAVGQRATSAAKGRSASTIHSRAASMKATRRRSLA